MKNLKLVFEIAVKAIFWPLTNLLLIVLFALEQVLESRRNPYDRALARESVKGMVLAIVWIAGSYANIPANFDLGALKWAMYLCAIPGVAAYYAIIAKVRANHTLPRFIIESPLPALAAKQNNPLSFHKQLALTLLAPISLMFVGEFFALFTYVHCTLSHCNL